ncbi:MAG TPA: hypothetical protein VEJ19_08995 [Nitrososphaerales archaeon]|nr:hypothetical protein [Nitrososphaerales archaeon]
MSEPVKVWQHEPEYYSEEEVHQARSYPSSVDAQKEIVEFKHYCSCKHCKHEWTEAKTVEFDR